MNQSFARRGRYDGGGKTGCAVTSGLPSIRQLVAMAAAAAAMMLALSACERSSGPSVPANASDSVLLAASPSPATLDQPIAFCAAAGTNDNPSHNPRYTGEPHPKQIEDILKAQPAYSYARPADYYLYATWRCVAGEVRFCVGNPTCDHADSRTEPSAKMRDFCRKNPEFAHIANSDVPWQSVYSWVCHAGEPKTERQIEQVDEQGFIESAWHPLP